MIGRTLSHFEITAKLGEGGMGEVYRAVDTRLGREVTIKVLPEALARDPERLARTRVGALLGTAPYMSPEQIRGAPVDRRTDIWAFGAVLWEMLTGRHLHEGESPSDIMASVLRAEIDWSALPESTPASLLRLLRRCLERDPRRRLQWIGDARIELEQAEEELGTDAAGEAAPAGHHAPWRHALPWLLAATLGAAALWLGLRYGVAAPADRRSADALPTTWTLPPPAGGTFVTTAGRPSPPTAAGSSWWPATATGPAASSCGAWRSPDGPRSPAPRERGIPSGRPTAAPSASSPAAGSSASTCAPAPSSVWHR